MFDRSTAFGARVEQRLKDSLVIWLTTVKPDGTPEPNPVWFLWENSSILIYSQPAAFKVRNLTQNPKVSLHFDTDPEGSEVIVFTGEANIDQTAPKADQHLAYLKKYRQGIADINMDPESFANDFSIAVRIKPLRLRGY
jgi:PPOX class probable F420-dependent enzyme